MGTGITGITRQGRPFPPSPPHFMGEAERQAYYDELRQLPERTRHKLRAINREGHSAKIPARVHHNVKHIFMAIKAALFDGGMQRVVRDIIHLRREVYLAKRYLFSLRPDLNPGYGKGTALTGQPLEEAERGALKNYALWAERMQDYHIALDWVTGMTPYSQILAKNTPLVEDCPLDQLRIR